MTKCFNCGATAKELGYVLHKREVKGTRNTANFLCNDCYIYLKEREKKLEEARIVFEESFSKIEKMLKEEKLNGN